MMRPLKSLLSRKSRTAAPAAAPEPGRDLPQPEHTSYIVGDIHGRADLLELILELIDAHIGGTGAQNPQLIFVGDYIDRGPASADVLARLRELSRDFSDNVTCIMGNHERMMLDFLADPTLRGPRWIREGGASTLASFRVSPNGLDATAETGLWENAATRLSVALGPEMRSWLNALPLNWCSGNLWAVHAGADPQRRMEEQTSRVLLWGHPEFDSAPRGDQVWIAHGHTEMAAPTVLDGRISLDTAAWTTGRLTACAIRPDGRHDFLQT